MTLVPALAVGRAPHQLQTPPMLDEVGPSRQEQWDRVRPWQFIAFLSMGVVILVTSLHHTPWFDEAQAWLIARDDSLWDLLGVRMRHEGTTPLWHLLLLMPARAGLPYWSINVISGVATLAGAWLLLRRAPFPPWLSATIPFSYFILFQYGVVARNYCLLAPLLWWSAVAYARRKEHPWMWMLPLLLLAEVSVHGVIIAVCWTGLRVLELWRQRSTLDAAERRRQLRPIGVMAIVVLVAVIELWPTSDVSGGGQWKFDPRPLSTLLDGGLLSTLEWVALAALLATLPWMASRGVLWLFVLPALALLGFFIVRYFSPWHGGVLFELWLAVLWMGYTRPARPLPWRLGRMVAVVPAAAALVLLPQLLWSAQSVRLSLAEPYSGAAALADYIRSNHLEHQVAAEGKWIVASFPYFHDMVVTDYNAGKLPAYYPWSRSGDPLPSRSDLVENGGAKAVVISVEARGTANVNCINGYRLAATFPGHVFVTDHAYESEAYLVFLQDLRATAGSEKVCAQVSP